jgi:hypothetical protein
MIGVKAIPAKTLQMAGQKARGKKIAHIVAYHPDRLIREPRDLEKLLTIADEHGITLHGKASHRDLSDPGDRHYLRGEVVRLLVGPGLSKYCPARDPHDAACKIKHVLTLKGLAIGEPNESRTTHVPGARLESSSL